MAFGLGTKTLLSYCKQQDPLLWQKAKVTPALFKAHEMAVYEFVAGHLKSHHALPHVETVNLHFPDTLGVETPEPPSYYLGLLEHQFYYTTINAANLSSQEVLKTDQDDYEKATGILRTALLNISAQKQRVDVMDMGKEGAKFLLSAYHNLGMTENISKFGWDYLDSQQGGVMPGDIVSFVGRPAAGKTYLMLWVAIQNWLAGSSVLFVSMEMGKLPISQRIAAMYTHCPISQLKTSAFSKHTYDMFVSNISGMAGESGKFYVVNGRLAATMDDIYMLADQLQCKTVVIDGAYLVKHSNGRLDRFTRVAENCELAKTYTEELDTATFASWQFNREATKNQKKTGKQETNLEDIGYSDAIGQISSIACGMYQEDGVETMERRKIRLMKGRNGEMGQFTVNWDFAKMDFSQVDPPVNGASEVGSMQGLQSL
jgi:replicative DNA helicase